MGTFDGLVEGETVGFDVGLPQHALGFGCEVALLKVGLREGCVVGSQQQEFIFRKKKNFTNIRADRGPR